jgi:RimJ/RimL family protein N-acetyltransferase
MRAGISESTRPAAAKEPDRPQIINNRPLAVSLPRPDEFLRLGIEIVDGSELIGMVGLGIDSERHGSAGIGYGISPNRWGHGYATEAAQLIVGFAFDALGLHRVWASHHPDNIASRKVLEKVGLREEGRRRDDGFVGGVWYDSVMCSILEDEWRLKRGSSMSNSGPE